MNIIKKYIFKLKMKWYLFKSKFKKQEDREPEIYIYEEDE
jgi:hypothetical protein